MDDSIDGKYFLGHNPAYRLTPQLFYNHSWAINDSFMHYSSISIEFLF